MELSPATSRSAVEFPQAALDKPRYFALSRTTDQVLRILLRGNLARMRADSVAETLGISGTTMRRRLRADHTSYQFLLDRARQYRCERRLRQQWVPGKCLADELGYNEVNSFYRAFRRWTGQGFNDYKQHHAAQQCAAAEQSRAYSPD